MFPAPIVILGPTAAGKSALALAVAQRLGGIELVSVDSMQVYRGMDIGTAKPTRAEQSLVPHHGIDLIDPDQEFSLAEFVAVTNEAIADIESRGLRPVLVGGTGLYLRAVVDDLDLPGQFLETRAAVETNPDTRALHFQLQELDPVAAARMEPDNRRRIVRALEVTLGSGRPFSSYGPGLNVYPETRFKMIGLTISREMGWEKINRRVDEMMEAGFVAEVADLRARFTLSKTARQALGYREILRALDEVEFVGLADEIKARTRSFARRQRVWFRRDPRIKWIGHDEMGEAGTSNLLSELLREFES